MNNIMKLFELELKMHVSISPQVFTLGKSNLDVKYLCYLLSSHSTKLLKLSHFQSFLFSLLQQTDAYSEIYLKIESFSGISKWQQKKQISLLDSVILTVACGQI